jgi:succinate dehydrogenase/fumarate reductase cytochrome b subunit
MLEAKARKIHRTVGIYLVGFLALQLVTGLFISLGTLMDTPRDTFWFAAMAWIHHEWNPVGSVYRILLGALAIAQGLGGVVIYLLMRARLTRP